MQKEAAIREKIYFLRLKAIDERERYFTASANIYEDQIQLLEWVLGERELKETV